MTNKIEIQTTLTENTMLNLLNEQLNHADEETLNNFANKACIAAKGLFAARAEELYGESSMPETKMKEFIQSLPVSSETATEETCKQLMASFTTWTRELGRKDMDRPSMEESYKELLTLIARARNLA